MFIKGHKTDVDKKSVKISRVDIGKFGTTEYISGRLCDRPFEEVNTIRLFGTSVAIGVGENKKVNQIQFMRLLRENYTIYLQDNGTVDVSYDWSDEFSKGHAFEEFADKFEWAEEQVKKTRKRYAHLTPKNLKEALGIE